MSTQLPAEIAEAIERLAQASRTEGYAMSGGTAETEAQAERNANSARLALDAVILKHLGGWRPIESIPKDGRKVMLYRPLAGESNDPVISIRRTTSTSQHCWPDTIPPGCDGQNFTEGCCYATHWQPLPEPPATTLGRAALAEEGRG